MSHHNRWVRPLNNHRRGHYFRLCPSDHHHSNLELSGGSILSRKGSSRHPNHLWVIRVFAFASYSPLPSRRFGSQGGSKEATWQFLAVPFIDFVPKDSWVHDRVALLHGWWHKWDLPQGWMPTTCAGKEVIMQSNIMAPPNADAMLPGGIAFK